MRQLPAPLAGINLQHGLLSHRAELVKTLSTELAARLADHSARARVPQAQVVEVAIASHLSPDAADQLEAALARRLGRMSRAIERMERHTVISNEAMALFVRFWLTSTPPLPDTAQPAAQAKGREHYEGFVEALGRRLAKGQSLADEVSRDIGSANGVDG